MALRFLFAFFGFSLINICALCGQVLDSVILMDAIEIKENALRTVHIGSSKANWKTGDSSHFAEQTLDELLRDEAGIFIKSYGLGSLATSSIRGGSGGHTLVLWNGLPVQSPMLGLLDLALLPTAFADNINLQRGGGSALWGSGAIGGVINMTNSAPTSTTPALTANARIGSFGNWGTGLKATLGTERLKGTTKIDFQRAENDFPFEISATLPTVRQQNAALEQINIAQDLYYRINARQTLSAHYWGQHSDRQIPPPLAVKFSDAAQTDIAHRGVVNWKRRDEHLVLKAKGAYFNEQNQFAEGTYSTNNRFASTLGEFTAEYFTPTSHSFLLGTTQMHNNAQSPSYADVVTEWRSTIFASYRYTGKTINLQSSVRQEWVAGNAIPLVPTVGVTWQALNQLGFRSKISRNYRLPTLNDQFWIPGGNPDLLPEEGWSQELGLDWTSNPSIGTTFSVTAFNRLINNWVLWNRAPDQSFWSPSNITKVWSRGLEARASWQQSLPQGNLQFEIGYDYIRSTNQVAVQLPRIPEGQQLWYTPEHQAFAKADLRYSNWQLTIWQRYTGASLGTEDRLDAYWLTNLRLAKRLNNPTQRIELYGSVDNVFNTNYIVIERRPMPGHAFTFGLTYALQ